MRANATNRKIGWFKEEADKGALDLSASFQRKPVWTEEQSSYLIDSVLSGLPFPEIYVRTSTTPEGRTTYEVVDGQQRLRAILAFAGNDLALVGDEESQVSGRWVGKRFEDLNSGEKTSFWSYDVVVRDLERASDGEIRDLFRRLNINQVVLTDQELRHARYQGRFIKLMEELADDEWWVDSRIVTVRQVRRMEDVEFVSELFVGLMAGPQNKKDTLDGFYENYETDFPEASKHTALFRQTRALLETALTLDEVRQWSGKSDFYGLFLAFGELARQGVRLTPSRRERVSVALVDFRKRVDQAKRKDNARKFTSEVHEYADAVTRAASDAGRRTTRLRILSGILSENVSARRSA